MAIFNEAYLIEIAKNDKPKGSVSLKGTIVDVSDADEVDTLVEAVHLVEKHWDKVLDYVADEFYEFHGKALEKRFKNREAVKKNLTNLISVRYFGNGEFEISLDLREPIDEHVPTFEVFVYPNSNKKNIIVCKYMCFDG